MEGCHKINLEFLNYVRKPRNKINLLYTLEMHSISAHVRYLNHWADAIFAATDLSYHVFHKK